MLEMAIGFFIALCIGLTGVGGGTLTVPVLVLFLGLPAPLAVGTSLVFVTLIKIVATPMYWARQQVDLKAVKLLLLGGLPGVLLGSLVITNLKKSDLEPYVLALVGGTVTVMAAVSLWKSLSSSAPGPRKERRGWLPWFAAPIGLEVGFSSAGAGALGSLLLMHSTTLTSAEIVGTDLMFGLGISGIGGLVHASASNVDFALLMKMALGGIAGAVTGAWLGTRMPTRAMRLALSVVLVCLGASLAWKGAGTLLAMGR